MFDDNLSPTNAFVGAGRISRGRDAQFNHIWSEQPRRVHRAVESVRNPGLSGQDDRDTHPEVTAALQFRADSLYGLRPQQSQNQSSRRV